MPPPIKYLISAQGITRSLYYWCKRTGYSRHTIIKRLNAGWGHEAIINTPPRRGKRIDVRKCKQYTHSGITLSLSEWSDILNRPIGTLHSRIKMGFSQERIFSPNILYSSRNVRRLVEHEGVVYTAAEIATKTGLHKSTILSRISRGWRAQDIVECPCTPLDQRAKGRYYV